MDKYWITQILYAGGLMLVIATCIGLSYLSSLHKLRTGREFVSEKWKLRIYFSIALLVVGVAVFVVPWLIFFAIWLLPAVIKWSFISSAAEEILDNTNRKSEYRLSQRSNDQQASKRTKTRSRRSQRHKADLMA